MYRREEYIKNITGELSHIQSELDMRNEINLYDMNIISENFFAGLLNLVYGYELQNANYEKKNAKAIDLFDNRNKIAVQVTHKNDSAKIQETIDKFIEDRLYTRYDRLIMLLLRSRKKYTTAFQTKGLFHFDAQNDIIDIEHLIWKISTLDTETLKAIDAYCAAERDTDQRHGGKRKRALCVMGIVFLAACVILIGLSHAPIARVYASHIYPYTDAGSYGSFADYPTLYTKEIETYKAFAIMSSVRTYNEKVSSIEQQYCEILSLEPVEEAVVRLDAVMMDDILYLFAFNDGWGDADTPLIKSVSLTGGGLNLAIDEVIKSVGYARGTGIKAAGAVFLAKYVLDSEALEHYCKGINLWTVELNVHAEGMGYACDFSAYLNWGEDGFFLDYGGAGGPGYKISLFAVLDVDRNPSAIYFTGENATPFIEEVLQIETVLAPTKSCIVKCRNVFSVNGRRQQTETYTAKVTVPAFADGAIGNSGLLTQELAQLQNQDEASIDRLVSGYLYEPESIKNGSSD